jgi:AcrR family transcriptional regulator
MATDESVRARILAAADDLFTAQGFGATTVADVADAAGTSKRTVRRLVGGKLELLEAVLAQRPRSGVAGIVGAAAEQPDLMPPLSVLIEAAHRLIADPQGGWEPLELEAMARSGPDTQLRAIAVERLRPRSTNAAAVAAASRAAGGVDSALSDNAVVHFSMALSLGLAMLDPIAVHRPSALEWDALIARIGAAVAPPDMLLARDYEVSTRWRVRVDIPDRAGGIARIVRALAALHVYTAYLQVVGSDGAERTIDLGLVAPPNVSAEVIVAAAESAGRNAYITTGVGDADIDLLTQTLDGATYLVKHPEEAPRIAAALVAADDLEVIDAAAGVDDRADVLRLQWTAHRHVLLHRRWAPFARTEQQRASALLRLSAAIARISGDDDVIGWIEAVREGTVWIRLARPEDADKVAAMHERCSERSRYQRYFAHTQWRDIQLRRLAGGHRGATLVAMSRDGDIVALGNVFPHSSADPGTAEIAILVEDGHQGGGVGTALLRRMLQVTPGMGFTRVVADVLADNAGMRTLLQRTGLDWSTTTADGVATMVADLPAEGDRPPVAPPR